MKIGPYTLTAPVILAPMAGVTDLPFRRICREMGAGLVVSEMVASDDRVWDSRKSVLRRQHDQDDSPRSVQIVGNDPQAMAQAARLNVEAGAQIIDINMGCPAKKVCQKAAGSALLKDEALVEQILQSVVQAVSVPVTLKIRTGWCPASRNGVRIAQIAEQSGIQALAVHGRTRACAFQGQAEYQTIADIKRAVSIPVIANGDIQTPEKAKEVLDQTAADGIMIGRPAQGNPWIFREVSHFLTTGEKLAAPKMQDIMQVALRHLSSLHTFYGECQGVRIARKHLGWYITRLPGGNEFRHFFNRLDSASDQLASAEGFFVHLIKGEVMAA